MLEFFGSRALNFSKTQNVFLNAAIIYGVKLQQSYSDIFAYILPHVTQNNVVALPCLKEKKAYLHSIFCQFKGKRVCI